MRRKFKESVVQVLNTFDGWELKLGKDYATGKTPKGLKCIVAFENGDEKPYIDKDVFEYLKKKEDLVQVYIYFHPRGNYMFWLNDIIVNEDLTLNPKDAALIHLAH